MTQLSRKSCHLSWIRSANSWNLALSFKHFTFVWICVASLANNAHERDIRHALVPYPALYPSFQENLDRFRQREQEELLQRGAEQVFQNAELYNTRQSSEDGNPLVEHHREDAPVEGPQEQQVEEENRDEPSHEHLEEATHQPDDNTTTSVSCTTTRRKIWRWGQFFRYLPSVKSHQWPIAAQRD